MIGALAAGLYLYNRVDEQIRRQAEVKIAAKYPHLKVSLRSARLLDGEGIELRGLSIRNPAQAGSRGDLAYFDEIFLACPTDIEQLIQGEPPVSHIIIRRPVLRGARQDDGTWNLAKLLPIPQFGPRAPDSIVVEGAVVELKEHGAERTFSLRDIQLTLTPGDRHGAAAPDDFDIRGQLSGDYVQRIELSGKYVPRSQAWALSGQVDGLQISPELRQSLPADITSRLGALASLRGQARFKFKSEYDPQREPGIMFEVDGQLAGGRVDDPRLPYPITDLSAGIYASNEGLLIQNLAARAGKATLKLACRTSGLSLDAPLSLSAETRQFELDEKWLQVLPESLRQCWHKFLPEGTLDADLKLAFDGQKWTPELTARCLDVSFAYYKFPYRLEHGTGSFTLKDDKLDLQMTAFSGSEPVQIRGEVLNPGPGFTGWVELHGNNLVADQNVLAALPEKPREVLRSLNPSGTFNVALRLERHEPTQEPMGQHLVITPNRCSMRYDKFPYPIGNIRGIVRMVDGRWTFENLEGSNDTGRIRCTGGCVTESGQNQLVLNFDAEDVPLEEELRDALNPQAQAVWNDLKPLGTINLRVEVGHRTGEKVAVVVRGSPAGESTSIQPVYFPYRFEKLQGLFIYREGQVEFQNVSAVHGRTGVTTLGLCDFTPDGAWRLRFENLTADRVQLDRDLFAALPAGLRKCVGRLNPQGPMNIQGMLELSKAARDQPVASSWDVDFDMHQGSLDCGIDLRNIYGGVRLSGTHDGSRLRCRGELAVDSLTYKDFQFTELRGPLWVDDERALLGGWTQPRGTKRPRRLTAKCYGGTLLSDCWVVFGSTPKYGLQADLSDGNLNRFAQEKLTGRQELKGKVQASVDLGGAGSGTHSLSGRGKVRLRDADVYELPLMVALLKILSIRTPDTTGFTTSDIDFRIEGDHIYLDRIDLSGDAISLVGNGEMNFDTQIRLVFYSLLGRSEMQIPFVKKLLGSASQQVLLIHVDGDLSNPQTRSEAFPGVAQALQQLQEGQPLFPPVITGPR